jgi:hypothetical protein
LQRSTRVWRAFFTAACLAVVVCFLATPDLRIVGLLLVPLAGVLLSRLFLNLALDDLPHWWRRFAYSGWHGRYRAFEGHRVRVSDGEKERPSRVYAADIFGILGLAPSPLELQKLEARFRGSFQRGAEGSEANEWLFDDAACIAFVRAHLDDRQTPRGRTAQRLVLWLQGKAPPGSSAPVTAVPVAVARVRVVGPGHHHGAGRGVDHGSRLDRGDHAAA